MLLRESSRDWARFSGADRNHTPPGLSSARATFHSATRTMDYETAIKKLDPHQPMAFCVTLLKGLASPTTSTACSISQAQMAQVLALPERYARTEHRSSVGMPFGFV